MGFPAKWCKWIHGILSSARATVLVNGSPTFKFQCHKGMRQGDPISPFLLLIVKEGFSRLINMAAGSGLLNGLKLPNNGPVISHLLYADDCTFVGEWSVENLHKVARVLRVFFLCSELKINLGKSILFGVGVDNLEVKQAAAMFKCKEGSLPFTYLGLQIGGNMNRVSNWNFLFDIFEKRLTSWKANTLSMGGRVTLMKVVLESLPTYYFSLFAVPSTVIDGIESIIRRFLSSGSIESRKINWVSWDTVASPMKVGGLGISKLRDSNLALLAKWIWHYRTQQGALWRKVIDSIHGSCIGWRFFPVNHSLSSVWKTIVSQIDKVKVVDKRLNDLIKGVCGKGDLIRFCDSKRFIGEPSWYSMRMSPNMISEWLRFRDLIYDIRTSEANDRWVWLGDSQNVFSVKSVKRFIRSGTYYSGRMRPSSTYFVTAHAHHLFGATLEFGVRWVASCSLQ
uniref:uncharacterized protein LOC122591558 n=1 Tax=Erigeron canadensis TaxID=72917 RepID=UPI001CB9D1AD|nr:uncharacterized protein LOC122591558 [Erigeron canadensis]